MFIVTFKMITCPILIIKGEHHTKTKSIILNNTQYMQPELIFMTSLRAESSGELFRTRQWIFTYHQKQGNLLTCQLITGISKSAFIHATSQSVNQGMFTICTKIFTS